MQQVCFRSDMFMLFLILNIGIIVWALYQAYQRDRENITLQQTSARLQEKENMARMQAQSERAQKEAAINQMQNIAQANREEGFIQGEERMGGLPPSGGPPQAFGLPVNIPTRGEPTDFYVVGYLSRRKDPNQMMKLMERYLYSDRYEYATTNHLDPTIIIPVYTHNYNQLSDGDHVRVPGYKGKFRVNIYPRGELRII